MVKEPLNLRLQHKFSRPNRASQGPLESAPSSPLPARPVGAAKQVAAIPSAPWPPLQESDSTPRSSPPSTAKSACESSAPPQTYSPATDCTVWPSRLEF